ncbi:MAG: GNAT family N-acetyltransferase [Bacteroidota bacterium]
MLNRFPQLYTPRLILRKLEVEDIPSLLQQANNPKIADRIVNIPYPYEEPTAVFRLSYVVQGFKQKNRYVFTIISKEREHLIGEISLHILEKNKLGEIGYWLGEEFWGQGLTSEAVAAITTFAFTEIGLTSLTATTNQDNLASMRVLEKAGFQQIGQKGNLWQFLLEKKD